MERMPENFDKKDKEIGQKALRVIEGILDGTIPADKVAQTGIRNATPETVKEVLEKNTVVTPAMKRDAEIANLKHNLKEDED